MMTFSARTGRRWAQEPLKTCGIHGLVHIEADEGDVSAEDAIAGVPGDRGTKRRVVRGRQIGRTTVSRWVLVHT